ncbi:uncharacterized protein LOC111270533 [Varroa jacobsoni]|uniref:uncharacterized protein LOC111270533 n=1 Tax=Varroa jacobsoni TaxID=62625 RepID=UPI000BF6249B|nr:uncharacterized protein LOC111270533 [Varroa jacobsoni]
MGGASEGSRRLLASIAEARALYATSVWAEMALTTKVNRDILLAAQRIVAIRVARAYRTVLTEALLVLAKMVPWDLLAIEGPERRQRDDSTDNIRAREDTMNKWQQQWENPRTYRGGESPGSWTRHLIPDVRKWIRGSQGELTSYPCQVLSGHGQFQTYMTKIGKTQVGICVL